MSALCDICVTVPVYLPLNMPCVSMSMLARSPFNFVTPYWLIAWICRTTSPNVNVRLVLLLAHSIAYFVVKNFGYYLD